MSCPGGMSNPGPCPGPRPGPGLGPGPSGTRPRARSRSGSRFWSWSRSRFPGPGLGPTPGNGPGPGPGPGPRPGPGLRPGPFRSRLCWWCFDGSDRFSPGYPMFGKWVAQHMTITTQASVSEGTSYVEKQVAKDQQQSMRCRSNLQEIAASTATLPTSAWKDYPFFWFSYSADLLPTSRSPSRPSYCCLRALVNMLCSVRAPACMPVVWKPPPPTETPNHTAPPP